MMLLESNQADKKTAVQQRETMAKLKCSLSDIKSLTSPARVSLREGVKAKVKLRFLAPTAGIAEAAKR